MALELVDTASIDESLTDGDTRELVVDTATADYFEVLVDDGSGGTPASYDVDVDFYSTAVGGYMTKEDDASTQAFSPAVNRNARGQRVRVVFGSNATANFRVSLESYKEI